MNKSETMKELAIALSKAQAEMPPAEMNATNPFLKNKYADLGSIIKTAKPILAKYGLSVSQLSESVNGSIGVTTILMHSSGEWIESTMVLPVVDAKGLSSAQAAGSIISYLRRYSLSSILGMYADEDTDGNAPQPAKTKSKPAGPSPSLTPLPTEPQPELLPPSNGDVFDAVVAAKLSVNAHAARAVLQNYCRTGYDTDEKAIDWVRIYRAWKDLDLTTTEAAAKANLGESPK